jgi:hypothetical protein
MSLLLTLTTASLQTLLDPKADPPRTLMDVPDFAINSLQLRGLNINAAMLSGWGLSDLDGLRDRADKAACPCLVLVEEDPLPFGVDDDAQQEAATERVRRLAVAGNRLGCNALAVRCSSVDDDDRLEACAEHLKGVMSDIEHLDLNLLLTPHEGLTADPDRLTELIKRIGGFRIGAMPIYGRGSDEAVELEHLRKLAPYAGAIQLRVDKYTRAGKHKGLGLASAIDTIRKVGYLNTVTIDYTGGADPSRAIECARVELQDAIDAE